MLNRLIVFACLAATLLIAVPASAHGYYGHGHGYYGHGYRHPYYRHHHYYRRPYYSPRY